MFHLHLLSHAVSAQTSSEFLVRAALIIMLFVMMLFVMMFVVVLFILISRILRTSCIHVFTMLLTTVSRSA